MKKKQKIKLKLIPPGVLTGSRHRNLESATTNLSKRLG